MKNCIICNNECKMSENEYECNICKKYKCEDEICKLINISKNKSFLWEYYDKNFLSKLNKNLYKIQCYIREMNDDFKEIPILTKEKIKQIIELPDKTLKEQFDLLLMNLYKYKNAFLHLEKQNLEIIRIKSWVKDFYILSKLFEKAYSEGLLKKEENYSYVLNDSLNIYIPKIKDFTFKGLEYIESLNQPNQNSKKIFLAFSFKDDLNNIFKNTVSDMIRSLGLNPMIVNQNTTSHDEKISDKIISELKSSKILIADLTYHSQNVYYEIGYAMGMGIPVILTCKKEDIKDLSFDINQYPVFEWEDGNELSEKIENRLKVLL